MYGCRLNRLFDYLLCVCIFAVLGFSVDAQAQMSGDTANELGKWWQASTSGFKTVPPQSVGSFVVPYNAGPTGVPGEVSMRAVAGSWPDAAAKVSPRGMAGAPAIDVVAKVKPAAFAAAVGRFASKVAGPLSVGLAVYDLANELGFLLKRNPDGSLGIDQSTTSDGMSFFTSVSPGPYGSKQAACQATGYAVGMPYVGPSPDNYCFLYRDVGLTSGNSWYLYVSAGVPTTTVSPATRQQFIDAIAAKSGWPAGSRVADLASDLIRSGEVVQVDPPTVSGPASSPPKVSSSQKSDGTTVKTTTTNNYNYAGNNVAVTTVTNVENYNPTTNVTTTETTVNSGPGEATKPTDCEANPNSVGCSQIDAVPEGVIPKETKNVAYAVESLNWGASASCPAAMSFNAPVTGKSFQLEYTPFCDVASRMRPFILAGAAFVAMMIVMAGVKA